MKTGRKIVVAAENKKSCVNNVTNKCEMAFKDSKNYNSKKNVSVQDCIHKH